MSKLRNGYFAIDFRGLYPYNILNADRHRCSMFFIETLIDSKDKILGKVGKSFSYFYNMSSNYDRHKIISYDLRVHPTLFGTITNLKSVLATYASICGGGQIK